jgi:hypothetical protein
MNSKTAISICLLALAPLTVHAQKIYMCKDASGRTLTSDRPIPECADRAVKELDNQGMVRREVAAPLTAEQKQQAKLDEEKKKADAIVAAERKRNDMAIMARFRNEDDIALARKRNTDLVQDQIKRESTSITNLEKKKKDVMGQMPAAKDKKDVMASLKRAVDEIDAGIAADKKKIQEYEAEVAQINEKYDATLKRYRELNGTAAAGK